MSVKVIVQMAAKPDSVDAIKALWRDIMADTRAFDGCIDIYVYEDQDDPGSFALIETWESRAQYDKYLAWRTETGLVDQIVAMAAGDLNFGFYDKTDI